MAYKLYTPRNHAQQEIHQWATRDLMDEVEVCGHRTLATLFEQYLPKEGTILEAGCGLGGWVRYLRDKGYDVVGLDRDANVVRRAREADPTLPVETGDITRLRWRDNELAGYISLGVIEHFEEGPQPALAEAFRVLKPGGRAIITVPALSTGRRILVHPLRSTVLGILRMTNNPVWFGEYRYSRNEVEGFITGAGFRVIGRELDEIKPGDPSRHIGIYADFPFMRAPGGAWRLNALGRGFASVAKVFGPAAFVNGWFTAVEKPA